MSRLMERLNPLSVSKKSIFVSTVSLCTNLTLCVCLCICTWLSCYGLGPEQGLSTAPIFPTPIPNLRISGHPATISTGNVNSVIGSICRTRVDYAIVAGGGLPKRQATSHHYSHIWLECSV